MRFCVLASSSSGNASLLSAGGFGVLVDLGLGPRPLARRLAGIGACWNDVHAALLTHVHGDHWNENSLTYLGQRHVPIFCHQSHATALKHQSPAFADLLENDQVCFYEVDRELHLAEGLACRPLLLRHDAGVTCGFRFDGGPDGLGQTWALAYAADLGSWNMALAEALADVDVLALEFNHDEWLEKNSGRARSLVRRVLGDHGHLSNRQAAQLLTEVLTRSAHGRLRHLVQLHLSGQCNHPELARGAVSKILRDHGQGIELHTPWQDSPRYWLALRPSVREKTARRRRQLAYSSQQPWLPGWEL